MATKSLSKLKSEMVFNQDLTRLVDSMKGVAAAQYHVMEHRKTNLERYTKAIEELCEVYDFRLSQHPFLRAANPKKIIGLVTTDSGFLGGLNMKVIQSGLKQDAPGSVFYILGERGVSNMREYGKSIVPFPGINADDTRYELVERFINRICSDVLKGSFGQVVLVAPYAVSFTVQRVEAWNLIPCPIFFKNKPEKAKTDLEQEKNTILESPSAQVIEYLTVMWLRKRLIELFEDAKLAEYGARTMHLESSYQTLSKIDKQLKLQFFKARREKIDQSLRESFTSQLLCKAED